jgi:hypothetical protein
VNTLILKLILTPILIGSASLAGRRWGPAISGWLVGLPLTSGPVMFFLALNQGLGFASTAAIGTLAGTFSQVVFSLAYAWVGTRYHWGWSFLAGTLAFALFTVGLQALNLPVSLFFILAFLSLVVGIILLPRYPNIVEVNPVAPPGWDIPARMLVATLIVVTLTGLAPVFGPRLTGLLSPFPVYAGVLTIFAHRQQGPGAATHVLRGLLLGLFGFASFFCILAISLEKLGIAPAFLLALFADLIFQAASLWFIQRHSKLPPAS